MVGAARHAVHRSLGLDRNGATGPVATLKWTMLNAVGSCGTRVDNTHLESHVLCVTRGCVRFGTLAKHSDRW